MDIACHSRDASKLGELIGGLVIDIDTTILRSNPECTWCCLNDSTGHTCFQTIGRRTRFEKQELVIIVLQVINTSKVGTQPNVRLFIAEYTVDSVITQ